MDTVTHLPAVEALATLLLAYGALVAVLASFLLACNGVK